MLNAGVQGAFQELADNYSHRLALPTEMALNNKTFISYRVTNFIWSQHFVAFEATSTFKAEINGRNETYIPNEGEKTTSFIPIGQWPRSSASDQQSNLLQGKAEVCEMNIFLLISSDRSQTLRILSQRSDVVCQHHQCHSVQRQHDCPGLSDQRNY